MTAADRQPSTGKPVASRANRQNGSSGGANPGVALISMPWMAPAMPSIQLATLEAALRAEDLSADVFEFYVDYAAVIGLNLYRAFNRLIGFNAEWVFSRHYFEAETGDRLEEFLSARPSIGLESRVLEERVLRALEPVTEQFLEETARRTDWSKYPVIGFSLCLTQIGASLALARLIKLDHPDVIIVFGGAECAGGMGDAMMRVCPYVDAVVRVEGEPVFPEIVRRVRDGKSLAGIAGVCYRDAEGAVACTPGAPLYTGRQERPTLDYDPYFSRLERLSLRDRMEPWIPFESSRGCWYGEKNQCTFCGLHEIMQFRSWNAETVLEELEELYERYEIGRFFSVDLIMPRDYFKTLLPWIEERGHDWSMFYEVKANMRREEVRQLSRAGVRWIQPGIESLDADILKLMKKGVSPHQNIQLLKWCREFGIRVGWNLITSLPGEESASYRRMARVIPKLVHLSPPSGLGGFQLHRFSPYFDDPDAFGIIPKGAHPTYRHVFPFPKDDLDDLMYLHDFDVENSLAGEDEVALVRAAVVEWWKRHTSGATLSWHPDEDGTARVIDSRPADAEPREYQLSAEEAWLYAVLETACSDTKLRKMIDDRARQNGGAPGRDRLLATLSVWEEQNLVVSLDGRWLALAVRASAFYPRRVEIQEKSPVPYLDEKAPSSAPASEVR